MRSVPAGPVFFFDSDGTTDVQMQDGLGSPWFMCRVRKGDRESFGWAGIKDTGLDEVRNTGVGTPPALPMGMFVDYLPWHMLALEPDFLLGRRGFAGGKGVRNEWH